MKVNCTSADVNGLPSCHFTPGRKVKVMVSPSGDTAHAQPPGPGFPAQAPSVYTTTGIPVADIVETVLTGRDARLVP